MSADREELEVIIETIRCGNSLKISAIDVATGTEVSITAPLDVDEAYSHKIATRKLEKRLGQAGNKPASAKPKSTQKGVII